MLLLLPLFGGCNRQQSSEGEPVRLYDVVGQPMRLLGTAGPSAPASQTSFGRPVSSPNALPTVIRKNPLTVSVTPYLEGAETTTVGKFAYVVVEGLADQAVQRAVNEAIYARFQQILSGGVAPYGGLEPKVEEGWRIGPDSTVQPVVTYNCNNLLSLYFDVRWVLEPPQQDLQPLLVTECVPMTFCLVSGGGVPLADLFADHCDYRPLVNNYLTTYITSYRMDTAETGPAFLYQNGVGVNVTLPLKGIRPSQKYYLTENGIQFVVDYASPSFSTNYSYFIIGLPANTPIVSEYLAYFDRFADAEGLYPTEPTAMLYRRDSQRIEQAVATSDGSEFGVTLPNCELQLNRAMPGRFENPLLQSGVQREYDAAKERMEQTLQQAAETYAPEDVSLSLGVTYDAATLGGYVVVRDVTVYAVTELEGGAPLQWEYTQRFATYSAKTGVRQTLSSLFLNGFDATSIILAEAERVYAENPGSAIDPEKLPQLLTDANFILTEDALVVAEYSSDNGAYPQTLTVPFGLLGEENLRCFVQA